MHVQLDTKYESRPVFSKVLNLHLDNITKLLNYLGPYPMAMQQPLPGSIQPVVTQPPSAGFINIRISYIFIYI